LVFGWFEGRYLEPRRHERFFKKIAKKASSERGKLQTDSSLIFSINPNLSRAAAVFVSVACE
jgi:hypothetical protein